MHSVLGPKPLELSSLILLPGENMIIQPKIRGFICTTAHPQGCALHIQEQINYAKQHLQLNNGPKKVRIIGASTG